MYEKGLNTGTDVVVAGSNIENKEKNRFIQQWPVKRKDVFYTRENLLRWLTKDLTSIPSHAIGVNQKLYKHSLLKDNNIRYDLKYYVYEDILFNICIYEKAESMILLPFISYTHFYNEGSLSRGGTNLHVLTRLTLSLIEDMRAFFERTGLMKKYKKSFYKSASLRILSKIFYIVTICDQNDSLIAEFVDAFHWEYFLYIHSLRIFLILLLLRLKQYKLLFGLYRAWHTLKQSIKKLLGR